MTTRKLTPGQQQALDCLRRAPGFHSPTAIGMNCAQGDDDEHNAKSWACKKLRPLLEMGLVIRDDAGRYAAAPENDESTAGKVTAAVTRLTNIPHLVVGQPRRGITLGEAPGKAAPKNVGDDINNVAEKIVRDVIAKREEKTVQEQETKIGVSRQFAKVRLTDDEVRDRGITLGGALGKLAELDNKFAARRAEYRDAKKLLNVEVESLRDTVNDRAELREIEADTILSADGTVVKFIRPDTGEVVYTRAATERDRQLLLPI